MVLRLNEFDCFQMHVGPNPVPPPAGVAMPMMAMAPTRGALWWLLLIPNFQEAAEKMDQGCQNAPPELKLFSTPVLFKTVLFYLGYFIIF